MCPKKTNTSLASVVSKNESSKLIDFPPFIPQSVVIKTKHVQTEIYPTSVPRYKSPGATVVDRLGVTNKNKSKNGQKKHLYPNLCDFCKKENL